MGATEKRRDGSGRVVAGFEAVSASIWVGLFWALLLHFSRFWQPHCYNVASLKSNVARRSRDDNVTPLQARGAGYTARLRIVRDEGRVYQESQASDWKRTFKSSMRN